MMVWFGSVDIGSAVIDADRLSQDFGNPGGYTLPAQQLQLQIMGQWQLKLLHNLLVFRLGGIVVDSFILPAWHGTYT
jgi:hypothetical protein